MQVIAYTAFEQLKNLLIARRANKITLPVRQSNGLLSKPASVPLTDLDNFLLGALTKLIATSITYPYLVIKSRMQAGAAASRKYRNAFHGLATIIKDEGRQCPAVP